MCLIKVRATFFPPETTVANLCIWWCLFPMFSCITLPQNITWPTFSFKILTLKTLNFYSAPLCFPHQSTLNFCNHSIHQSIWLTTRFEVFEILTYFREKGVFSNTHYSFGEVCFSFTNYRRSFFYIKIFVLKKLLMICHKTYLPIWNF